MFLWKVMLLPALIARQSSWFMMILNIGVIKVSLALNPLVNVTCPE